MGGLFKKPGGGHKQQAPVQQQVQAPTPTPTQANGAAFGATQNYGGNTLSGQSAIQRGTFLGS